MQKKYVVFVTVAGLLAFMGLQRAFGFPTLDLGLASTERLAPGEVETILALPEGHRPEGIALDPRGNLYVGDRRFEGDGRVPEILKIAPDGSTAVLATFPTIANPNEETLLGLATDATGNVYAAFHSFDPGLQGVWKVGQDGSMMRLAGSEAMVFPNALIFDARGNLYVTDSFPGSVWRFDPDGNGTLWVQHELLEPAEDDPFGFPVPGANGIAFYPPDQLYVANTEKGLVARIVIQPDGSAGAVELVAEGLAVLTIDGIAVDSQGAVYGAIPGHSLLGTHPLIEIDPSTAEVTPIVTSEDQIAKFDVPLSLAFGRGARDEKSVFITNGDLPIIEGGPGPGVVQAGVGVPGFPPK